MTRATLFAHDFAGAAYAEDVKWDDLCDAAQLHALLRSRRPHGLRCTGHCDVNTGLQHSRST